MLLMWLSPRFVDIYMQLSKLKDIQLLLNLTVPPWAHPILSYQEIRIFGKCIGNTDITLEHRRCCCNKCLTLHDYKRGLSGIIQYTGLAMSLIPFVADPAASIYSNHSIQNCQLYPQFFSDLTRIFYCTLYICTYILWWMIYSTCHYHSLQFLFWPSALYKPVYPSVLSAFTESPTFLL